MTFRGKRVAVLGYGVEGKSVAGFLIRHGAHLTVFDEKKPPESVRQELAATPGIVYVHGPFRQFAGYDMIVVSPGIRSDLQPLMSAKQAGTVITTATNIFMDLCPCPVIGVTGTKGKGTTSALITEMLKSDGRNAYLGGNIGTPPLEFLDRLANDAITVLELSSFQIMPMTKSPHVAVILMVTSEHLDYHRDAEEYIAAKANIVRYQGIEDIAVVNVDYPNSESIGSLAGNTPYEVSTRIEVERGVCVADGILTWVNGGEKEEIIAVKDIFIPGKHNWENGAAAACAAKSLGVKTHAVRHVLATFPGLPHRLEFVAEVGGVRYYDDSFSTTPETAIAAIEAFSEPKVLILGGSSKRSDFRELGRVIRESDSVRAVIGIGVEWERIKEAMASEQIEVVEGCRNMKDIVAAAREVSKPGDVVLLTPACASFDMFNNYKDRGEQFKQQVNAMVHDL